MSLPELLRVDSFVRALALAGVDVGRDAIYGMARRGELPVVRVGRKLFVVRRKVEESWGLELSADDVEIP